MRLFAAPEMSEPQRTPASSELLRRLAFGRPMRRRPQPVVPAPLSSQALPADLDQRVRQTGEW
jgi:hypothetical protein